MTVTFNVGALVSGAPTAPRALVRHAELLAAYADDAIGDSREAYLSHFVFGLEMQRHFAGNRQSVAGYVGPCCCRWLVLDIDRPDPAVALADTRRLVSCLQGRYPELADDTPVYFSGGKGYHILLDLSHRPPPAVGFNRVCATLAEALAARAGVGIDLSIYDIAHLIRLPNTRHPRTGLFKRRIDVAALFRLDDAAIRDLARHPAGDGLPKAGAVVPQLADDWAAAERYAGAQAVARAVARRDIGTAPDARAPRYYMDLLRFGVAEGERHKTVFQCAAWLAEQGAPPSLCRALLTEAGCDIGLPPKDVERQIRCGIEHAERQRRAAGATCSDPADAAERWAIEHEDDPLPPGATGFAFGALAGSEGGPA